MKSEADTGDTTERALHDKSRPYQCTICDKHFASKTYLSCHRKSHSKQKIYSCSQCERRFSFNSNLYQHMNLHKGKYKCTECGKCHRNNRDLLQHRRQSHTQEKSLARIVWKPFECTDCSERFRTSRELIIHGKIHSQQKPYKCRLCDKAFSQSATLKIHMRVHIEEKQSSFSQTNKSVSQTSDFQQRRQHCAWNKTKQYQCLECKKLFKTNYLWKRHVRLHTGAKLYSCKRCSDRFMWHSQLTQHLLWAHNEGT